MNKSLKEGEVNELKLHSDIYSIASNYVSLKKAGKNYLGLCPFHKEKTPSFTVDAHSQMFHCFGCGAGGDVIAFIMKIENLSFLEAIELLAKKTGYELKYSDSYSSQESDSKNSLFELNELAKKLYNFILFDSPNGLKALGYLKSRKISEKTLKKFEVGYAPDSWSNLTDFAKKRKYSEEDLLNCGLAIESKNERSRSRVYDRFRGRVMFPIKDLLGRTIAFGGRIIPMSESEKNNSKKIMSNEAKYINSPETKLYHKSKNIYGIFEAKSNIVEKDFAVIVEGYMDALALYENNISNVVASLGTALTIEQIKIIGRFTKNIILVFDSDDAGIKASEKAIERLKEYNENLDLYNENNISIKVCVLDKGFDPADYVTQKGEEMFLLKLDQSLDIIDFTIETIISRYNIKELSGKLRASDELLKFISSLRSGIIQEECIKKIASKLNLKESLLLEEMLKKEIGKNKNKPFGSDDYSNQDISADEGIEDLSLNPQRRIEVEALKLLISGADSGRNIIINLPKELFKFEDTSELFEIIKNVISNFLKEGRTINFPLLISSEIIKDDTMQKFYNFIYFSAESIDVEKSSCSEVADNLKKLYLAERIEKLRNNILELEKAFNDLKDQSDNNEMISDIEKQIDAKYKDLIKLEEKRRLFDFKQ